VPIAAVTLPELGLGLVIELAVSSPPNGLVKLDDTEPLERGGSGKSELLRGDEGPDLSTPLDSLWITLGRLLGGVAAAGKF